LDVLKPLQHKKIIQRELEGFGIRLNKQPPNIGLRRKEKGGINLQSLVPQSELDLDIVKSILAEYRIHNADVTLRYDANADDLIDVIEGNRSYIPCIYLLNKIGTLFFLLLFLFNTFSMFFVVIFQQTKSASKSWT
jgi:ribosome-interacting GTPase 1